MHEYTEELNALNPLTTHETFQKTQASIEELSASAIENSMRVEQRIQSGQIALHIDDEGHFARLNSIINEITYRLARKSTNEDLKAQLKQRTKELRDFMDGLLLDHNTLFVLVEKLAKTEKNLGL